MPPPTYYGLESEWDILTSAPTIGSTVFTTFVPTAPAGQIAVGTRMSAADGPSATFRASQCGFTGQLSWSQKYFRPWLEATRTLTLNKAAAANNSNSNKAAAQQPAFDPWQAQHTLGCGIASVGVFQVEYTLRHPTFYLNASATPERRGLPIEGTATVAAAANVDAGAYFKYDPFRSGLIDYTLGLRANLNAKLPNAVTTLWLNSRNQLSASFVRSETSAERAGKLTYGAKVSNNGDKVIVAAGVDSPCGRFVGAQVGVRPAFDLQLTLRAPLGGWTVEFAAKPLNFSGKLPVVGFLVSS